MAGRHLYFPQGYTSVEGGHTEAGPEHVGVDRPSPARLPMDYKSLRAGGRSTFSECNIGFA
jgi:hypothetical protein